MQILLQCIHIFLCHGKLLSRDFFMLRKVKATLHDNRKHDIPYHDVDIALYQRKSCMAHFVMHMCYIHLVGMGLLNMQA